MNHVSKMTIGYIRVLTVIGIIFGSFFVLVGLASFSDSFFTGFFLCLIGGFFLFISIKARKRIKLFRKYVTLLSSDPTHSLNDLAAKINKPVEDVQANIEKMIECGYFRNVIIDKRSNCLVFLTSKVPLGKTGSAEYKTVICKGCGAENTVLIGTSCECEFCGSKLQ